MKPTLLILCLTAGTTLGASAQERIYRCGNEYTNTVTEAQAAAYAAVDAISFPTGFCRRDIGWREVAREKSGEI